MSKLTADDNKCESKRQTKEALYQVVQSWILQKQNIIELVVSIASSALYIVIMLT